MDAFPRDLVVFARSLEWKDLLDVIVVTFLVYRLLLLIRGTRAVQLIAGIAVLALVGLVANILDFRATKFIFNNLAPALLIGAVVLFQPELRRALDRVGRVGFLGRPLTHYNLQLMNRLVEELGRAVTSLSEQRVGALIALERSVGLENYALTGVRVNADVTAEMLISIFNPRSPMHDGAVIIRGSRLISAGCLLPVSDEILSARLGTRHRAALGLSMDSDAVVIVVSEESGGIAIVQDGALKGGVDPEGMRQILRNVLLPSRPGRARVPEVEVQAVEPEAGAGPEAGPPSEPSAPVKVREAS